MYLAKNQHQYSFALSSAAFCAWSGLGIKAYNSAFTELVEQGYLIPKDNSKEKETRYIFYDKSQKEIKRADTVIIEMPIEKVNEVRKAAAAGV